jgi:hypothetical protein
MNCKSAIDFSWRKRKEYKTLADFGEANLPSPWVPP